jgi:hypothetical protein
MSTFQVKGVAFLAREAMVVAELGRPAWDGFLARFRSREPTFPTQILPVTLLTGDLFLRFNDQLAREAYPDLDRDAVYWQAGIRSAEFAFANQLRGLFQPGDAARFLAFTPRVYRTYFDSGELVATPDGPGAYLLRMTGTPQHPYFELAVMGFATGALRLLKAPRPEPGKLATFAQGHAEVLYRFFTA